MLSELCQELRNWFDRDQPHLYGAFEISNGRIADRDFNELIKPNQYFKIAGSVFNDGVWKNDENLELTDELFLGQVTLMAIPQAVLDLNAEIDDWITKYGDSASSPYQSESFGGYSYSKASGGNGSSGSGASWQSCFANRLNKWRKIL